MNIFDKLDEKRFAYHVSHMSVLFSYGDAQLSKAHYGWKNFSWTTHYNEQTSPKLHSWWAGPWNEDGQLLKFYLYIWLCLVVKEIPKFIF